MTHDELETALDAQRRRERRRTGIGVGLIAAGLLLGALSEAWIDALGPLGRGLAISALLGPGTVCMLYFALTTLKRRRDAGLACPHCGDVISFLGERIARVTGLCANCGEPLTSPSAPAEDGT